MFAFAVQGLINSLYQYVGLTVTPFPGGMSDQVL